MISIFKDIHDINTPYYISIEKALKRIQDGDSKDRVELVRNEPDKTKRNQLKKDLPSVVFGGKFSKRTDDALEAASGYISLDFDGFSTPEKVYDKKLELSRDKFIYAVWVSPSGLGLKALVRIPRNHHKFKNYFFSLMEHFNLPEGDMSCQNISRVCYESYDPDIYINKVSSEYTDSVQDIKQARRLKKLRQPDHIYIKLKDWLNKYDTFKEGQRNQYLFKLLCAMNRFGVEKDEACSMVKEFEESGFDYDEISTTVDNVYDNYAHDFNTVAFNDERSFEDGIKESFEERKGGYINPVELVVNPKSMSKTMHQFYNNELQAADTTGSVLLDRYLPFKRNEMYFWVGAGKIGKTTLLMYLLTLSTKFANWKWIICSTENAAFEIRHLIVSFLIGADAKADYMNSREKIRAAEDFFDLHFILVDATKVRSFEDHIEPVYRHLKKIGVEITGILIDPLQTISAPLSYGKSKSDDSTHTSLAEDYKKFSISECGIHLVAHTNSSSQRDSMSENKAPYPQSAKWGAVYYNACHVACTVHRNLNADKSTSAYYSTELRIFAQRSKFAKGGDTSTDDNIKFIYSHRPFGFNLNIDGEDEVNPLLPLETYYPSSVKSTGELKKFEPTEELPSLHDVKPNDNFYDNDKEDCPF